MVTMAPEMAQDRAPKRARGEPVQDGVIEGITRKEDEIKGVGEEIRRKDDEIRSKDDEIRRIEEKIDEMEKKIDEEIGPEQRKALEARLDFRRLLIRSLGEDKNRLGEDKNRLREDINRLREDINRLRESPVDKSRQWSEVMLLEVDKSRQWSEVMLLEELPALPKNAKELRSILFPTQTGKLPVIAQVFNRWKVINPFVADNFIVLADGSKFCVQVSAMLDDEVFVDSEVDVYMRKFFRQLDGVSSHAFKPKVLLNLAETSYSVTGSTLRPDTMVVASNCTFLVGEDKKSILRHALLDVMGKVQPISQVFYGPVRFMLGYVAAGKEFQWLYISNDKQVNRISPLLDLSLPEDRCKFLLSLGHVYKLIKVMAQSVPDLPGRRAMFEREENSNGDRILHWSHDSVWKVILDFTKHCKASKGSSIETIKQAYYSANKCKFLAHARTDPKVGRNGQYSVEISPLGCNVELKNERDGKLFARDVCEALSVLHKEGLVHRDVRLPNIVKVLEPDGKGYFMLIDFETVANADYILPEEFDYFRFWTSDTLEGSQYTPRSDMHHLGKILHDSIGHLATTPDAQEFIKDLIEKKLDAETALRHRWLTSSVERVVPAT
ncbi:hypothetical protein KC19_1G174800 [Ceratodon purpureus]|uniref:Protein kinase domain-containing protein n=1 Tax=Ceratodon purpureus TaxID=3225 RepID=A0A8T0J665_CERPU|nr:hypothetical protein KC19_1G174800 [Ceratodon purpureus]